MSFPFWGSAMFRELFGFFSWVRVPLSDAMQYVRECLIPVILEIRVSYFVKTNMEIFKFYSRDSFHKFRNFSVLLFLRPHLGIRQRNFFYKGECTVVGHGREEPCSYNPGHAPTTALFLLFFWGLRRTDFGRDRVKSLRLLLTVCINPTDYSR